MYWQDFNKNAVEEYEELKSLATRLSSTNNHDIEFLFSESKIASDLELHKLELEIRNQIIKNSLLSKRFWSYRSLDLNTYEDSQEIGSTYDRSFSPESIEKLFMLKNSYIKKDSCIVFNSGMAALNSAITIAHNIVRGPINTYFAYFETESLLREIVRDFQRNDTAQEFNSNLRKNNIAFLENPICSMDKYNINYNDLYNTLSLDKHKIYVLVVDSTLELEEDSNFFKLLKLPYPVIIFKLRSGQKLDQLGLELTNIGIVEVYSNVSDEHHHFITELLRNYRTVSGMSVNTDTYFRLSTKVINMEDIKKYKRAIQRNAYSMFTEISNKDSNLFNIKYKIGMPFIYLTPKSSHFDLKLWIDNLIKSVSSKEGYIPYGTSFGFRHTRLEIIDNSVSNPFVRLSPGKYLGPSNDILISHIKGEESC